MNAPLPHLVGGTCARCDHRDRCLLYVVDPPPASHDGQPPGVQWLRARQTLFCEGGPVLSVHCVCSGRVKLSKVGYGGEEFILQVCEPGTSIGLPAILADTPHQATAEALVDSCVRTLDRATFEARLAQTPELALGVMRHLALGLLLAHERLVELAQRGVITRAAHLLVTMAEEAGPRAPGVALPEIQLRRLDMAHMLGTTPETVSRVVSKLRARGVLAVHRDRIRIVDERKLRAIAGIFHGLGLLAVVFPIAQAVAAA